MCVCVLGVLPPGKEPWRQTGGGRYRDERSKGGGGTVDVINE